jgi:hypothetical protein
VIFRNGKSDRKSLTYNLKGWYEKRGRRPEISRGKGGIGSKESPVFIDNMGKSRYWENRGTIHEIPAAVYSGEGE